MVLDDSTMLRTANKEVYQELVETNKYFKRQIDLFVSALVVGLVNNYKSEKRQNHDIIRMGQLTGSLYIFKKMLNLMSDLICISEENSECFKLIFSYADGGLELMWDDYQAQGALDLPRLYDDISKKWGDRLPDVLALVKSEEQE